MWPQDADGEVHDEGEIIGETLWDTRDSAADASSATPPASRSAIKIYYGIVRSARGHPVDSLRRGARRRRRRRRSHERHAEPVRDHTRRSVAHGLADPSATLGLSAPTRDNFTITITTTPPTGSCPGATVQSATVDWRNRGGTDADDDDGRERRRLDRRDPDAARRHDRRVPASRCRSATAPSILYPDNPADPYYQFYVGQVTKIYCQDFETGATDWTHTGTPRRVGGRRAAGPRRRSEGRRTAAPTCSASTCRPTATTGSTLQPGHRRSPMIDLKGATNVHLQYYRWLGVEDGFYDHATITANGTHGVDRTSRARRTRRRWRSTTSTRSGASRTST